MLRVATGFPDVGVVEEVGRGGVVKAARGCPREEPPNPSGLVVWTGDPVEPAKKGHRGKMRLGRGPSGPPAEKRPYWL